MKKRIIFTLALLIGMTVGTELALRSMVWLVQARDRKVASTSTADDADGYPYFNTNDYAYMWDFWPTAVYAPYVTYRAKAGWQGKGCQHNSQGWRTRHELGPKTNGEFRVIITGGSFAWGAGVPDDRLYVKVMEDMLTATMNRPVRVVTTAMGSYNSTQEAVMILTEIMWLDPDVVIMLTGWNDTYQGYAGVDITREQRETDLQLALSRQKIKGFDTTWQPIEGTQPRLKNYRTAIEYAIRLAAFRIHGKPQVEAAFATRKQLSAWEQERAVSKEQYDSGFPAYNAECYALYREMLKDQPWFFDSDDAIADVRQGLFTDYVHMGDRGNQIIGVWLAMLVMEGL